MVFVKVGNTLFNTNSIRRVEKQSNGSYELVYAGQDKKTLSAENFQTLMNGWRGRNLISQPDATEIVRMRVSRASGEEAAEDSDDTMY